MKVYKSLFEGDKITIANIKNDGRFSGESYNYSFEVKSPNTGSEKQISWAIKIKHEYFNDLLAFAAHNDYEKVMKQYKKAIDNMNENLDSKYWIDNRGDSIKSIIKDHIK